MQSWEVSQFEPSGRQLLSPNPKNSFHTVPEILLNIVGMTLGRRELMVLEYQFCARHCTLYILLVTL